MALGSSSGGKVPEGGGRVGQCDCHTLGGTGNTRAMPMVPCPWCHPGVPPSERTPTHPGLTGTGALGLLACGIVFCHPISHPFPGPFLIWAARQ